MHNTLAKTILAAGAGAGTLELGAYLDPDHLTEITKVFCQLLITAATLYSVIRRKPPKPDR